MKVTRSIGLLLAATLTASLAVTQPASAGPLTASQAEALVEEQVLESMAKGGNITRSAVITRAKSWVDARVPYCLGYPLSQCVGKNYTNRYGTYRADCSGFVSMAWNLTSSRTTSTLPAVAHRISKSDLKAGDILNKAGVHVAIFHKWANDSKTEYWGYEQTPPHAVYRRIPYPYFNGGSGYLPYRYDNIVDDPVSAGAAKSVDGNRYDDLLAVENSTDVLWHYPGRSGGTVGSRIRVGGGWVHNYNRIAVGDANNDGWADLFATATDGKLFYWRNDRDGTFSSRVQVGSGWKVVSWFTLADVDGDGRADILAKIGTDLFLYRGAGNGTFGSAAQVGKSWGPIIRFTAADADGDGDADIWGTKVDGELLYWRGYGNGGFAPAISVGTNWDSIRQFTAIDVTGNGRADLVGIRTSDNALIRWTGNGNGTVDSGVQIGHGWSGYSLARF